MEKEQKPREYVPLPREYVKCLGPLTDEQLGAVIRALMHYAFMGEQPALQSPLDLVWNFVQTKDEYYAERYNEDRSRAEERSTHAKKAAASRWTENEEKKESEEEKKCSSMLEHARAYNIKSNQINTNQNKSNQVISKTISAEPECAESSRGEAPCLCVTLADKSVYKIYKSDVEA